MPEKKLPGRVRSPKPKVRNGVKKAVQAATRNSQSKSGKREMEIAPLRHCVMCGSNRVARKLVSVDLRNGLTVEAIEADVCPACGEQYFDVEAMTRLEAARRVDDA